MDLEFGLELGCFEIKLPFENERDIDTDRSFVLRARKLHPFRHTGSPAHLLKDFC